MNSARGSSACVARSRSNATSCSALLRSRSIKFSASRNSGRRPPEPRRHDAQRRRRKFPVINEFCKRLEGDLHSSRNREQASVEGPEFGPERQECGSEKVDVGQTDPCAGQRLVGDKTQYFIVSGDCGGREATQVPQNGGHVRQLAEGDFADHKGMSEDFLLVEQLLESVISTAKMVDPD